MVPTALPAAAPQFHEPTYTHTRAYCIQHRRNDVSVQGCLWHWSDALDRLGPRRHPHIAWLEEPFPLVHPVKRSPSRQVRRNVASLFCKVKVKVI